MTEQAITAIFAGASTFLVSLSIALQKRSAAKLHEATIKNRQIAFLDRRENLLKLQSVVATLAQMHSDGNGTLGKALRELAQTQRRLAELTGTAADRDLAFRLEARAEAHDEAQTAIDERQVKAQAELARLEKEL